MTDSRTNRLAAFTRSRYFTFALILIGILFIAASMFVAGLYVGMHKAGFAGHAGDSFERNFGPKKFTDPSMGMQNPHGAVGKIVSIDLPSLTLESDRMPEQMIRIGTDTVIRNGMDTVSAESLTAGTYVIVLGGPGEDGVVDAKLVRIVPAPAMPSH